MRVIYRIARQELSALFFSPVAWLVLIVFTIQSGIKFTDLLSSYQMVQSMGRKYDLLTARVFGGNFGFFSAVLSNLYLYIPLLTMGLISRETGSGSIKLLLSSPVRIREIVLGKFLGIMAYGLLLVLIVALYAFAGSFSILHMDTGLVVSGLIGIYLLICAYAAIGLFMSSLTTYQIVAAISTLMMLGLLSYIGNLFQRIDFVRDITWFLSISGRAEEFTNGLILSADVSYFVIVILLFLGLAFLKLLFSTESISVPQRVLRYTLLVAGALLMGYVSSRPALAAFADLTTGKRRTLTKNSRDIVKQFKSPVTITTYDNLLANYSYYGLPETRNRDLGIFQSFRLFMPDMKMNYEFYYDRPTDSNNNKWVFRQNHALGLSALAKKIADARDLDPDMFRTPIAQRKVKDLAPEGYAFTRELQYNGRTTYLRMFADMMVVPSEKEISAALKRLLVTPPKIVFLTGNEERRVGDNGDKDYKGPFTEKDFRDALINQGFDVDTLSLQQAIPDSLAALVIADPKIPFSDAGLQKIRAYVGKGGNLLLCGEPSRRANTLSLMNLLGVQMIPGVIATRTNDYEPDLLLEHLPVDAGRLSADLEPYRTAGANLVFPGAAGLKYSDTAGYDVKPFFTTNAARSWNTMAVLDPEAHNLSCNVQAGDQPGPFPVALTLTRTTSGREQRIMVFGDADFMAGGALYKNIPKNANQVFVTAMFSWFSHGQFPVDVSRPKAPDDTIKVSKKELSVLKWIFYGLLPALMLIFGAVLLVRRKRN